MYLDYDTAPAQIKARLIKTANLRPNDRSKLYVVQCLEKKGLITNSKYDGFLYQKKGKNNRNSLVFFDKIGFERKEQEKLEKTIYISNLIESYKDAVRSGAKLGYLSHELVDMGLFNSVYSAHMYFRQRNYGRDEVNKAICEILEKWGIK
ncbi:MAG: hypothetical protein MSH30_00160 [Campylobacter sp.]|uniref:hypothetical protein n=1 Tax=Campylobacter sp. TaxID=205 RepID=UPI002A8BDA1F|nr:hypothetical protein [Campylobacter sp.]MCI6344214.1 hypothetical protein [Campylobacter sp.]MCI6694186.1 hypothetical protein [Campylobacter sp.]MCI7361741.1 hypothetical protein [Campylobacter sp.]MDY4860358.1 hypothetical protein [Campylobacter sp.]